jgi:tetratricopeptide (TPR) repeat protein
MKRHCIKIIQAVFIFVLLFSSAAIAKEKAPLTEEQKKEQVEKTLLGMCKNFEEFSKLIYKGDSYAPERVSRKMDIDSGYRRINRVVGSSASVVQADIIMAKLSLIFGEYNEAMSILDKSLKFNLESAELLLFRAQLYFASKQYNETIENAGEVLKFDANNIDALLYLSAANRDLKQYDQALKYADKIIASYGSSEPVNAAKGYTAKAEIYLSTASKENVEKALDNISKAIASNPTVYEYKIRFGLYDAMRKYDEALKDLNAIVALEPTFERLFEKARYLSKLGKLEEAAQVYTESISLEPKNPNVYVNRGMIYSDLKNFEQAEADYKAAIKLNPKDPYVYNNLGVLYNSQGKYKAALKNYKLQKKVNPKLFNVYLNETETYLNMKNFSNALSSFQKYNESITGNKAILKSNYDQWDEILSANSEDKNVVKLKELLQDYQILEDNSVNKY